MLEINTLGGVAIYCNGNDVTVKITRKVQALLVYLASTRQAHSREFLAELLWHERPLAQALTNLRTVLTHLRQDFGAYVVVSRPLLSIDTQAPIHVDALQLDSALETARLHWQQHSHLPPTAAASLEKALALYKGRFLEGISLRDGLGFENWMAFERERLHGNVIDATHRLLTDAVVQGRYAESIPQATRLIELDPLREESHQLLMTVLAHTGQRSAALMQYKTCQRLLWDELGVEPSAETNALYEKIRRDQIEVRPVPVIPRGHLPGQTSGFVGRQIELNEIAIRLNNDRCRILTLVGPGGIGKTCLALQTASAHLAHFADGVYFVPLSGVSSPGFLVHEIAESIGLVLHSQSDARQQLLGYLQQREMLLLLDNFEQLLEGAALLLDILDNAPQVKLMVTSRERLKLKEEWLFDVHGLSYPTPDDAAAAEGYEAVQLFLQRALQIQSGFVLKENLAAITTICQLVEGMPLGIELAASWVRLLSCQAIAQQIHQNMDLLTTTMHDIPERHQSLRAVFEQSWQLLSENERNVLMKLSVFHGGFSLEAAQHVAGAAFPVMAALMDKSLVCRRYSSRYDLHELLRQFAYEKLEEANLTYPTRNAHLHYFLWAAEATKPKLVSHEQAAGIASLKDELDNLRSALTWCQDETCVEQGLRLGSALIHFWRVGGYCDEGNLHLERLLNRASAQPNSAAYAQALAGQGLLAIYRNDFIGAVRWAETALQAAQLASDTGSTALALNVMGTAARSNHQYANAADLYEQALFWSRKTDDPWLISLSLGNQGIMAFQCGEYSRAVPLLVEGLSLNEHTGNYFDVAIFLNLLGRVERCLGNDERAVEFCRKSIELAFEQSDILNFGIGLSGLAALAARYECPEHAATLLGIQGKLFEAHNLVMLAAFRADHDTTMQDISAEMGQSTFDSVYQRGRLISMEEAINYALSSTINELLLAQIAMRSA